MNRKAVVRALLVSTVLGVATAAQAQISVILVSNGMATLNNVTNTVSILETVDYQSGGLGAVQANSYTVGNLSFAGTGVYTGTGGSFTYDITFNPSTLTTVGNNESIDGTWTFVSGTGGYSTVASGGGTVALDLLLTSSSSAISGTALSGSFVPVPEPAAFAAMGIGVAGLFIRRRRKA